MDSALHHTLHLAINLNTHTLNVTGCPVNDNFIRAQNLIILKMSLTCPFTTECPDVYLNSAL